jgi:hypothetical protein
MAKRLPTIPGAFSEQEEEFFRAGSMTAQTEPVESFEDLDVGYEPPRLWQRIFKKSAKR